MAGTTIVAVRGIQNAVELGTRRTDANQQGLPAFLNEHPAAAVPRSHIVLQCRDHTTGPGLIKVRDELRGVRPNAVPEGIGHVGEVPLGNRRQIR